MSVFTMWIKIRTTLCFERFWPNDLKEAAEDAVGAQVPLEIANPPYIHVYWAHQEERNMLRHKRHSDSQNSHPAPHDLCRTLMFMVH